MTYVSRKSRISVSRWPNTCDAEYAFRACRKRSDGRLKTQTSCDDFRAWINDNCVKHEYLVELMSDTEFIGKPPFKLFGRFIPVPVLFKLTLKTLTTNARQIQESNEITQNYKSSPERDLEAIGYRNFEGETRSEDPYLKASGSFSRLQWEKSLLEKRFCECSCLLRKAVAKLERIDSIVGFHEDYENDLRNLEIRKSFCRSKAVCGCPGRNVMVGSPQFSKCYAKNQKESPKVVELTRKISCLMEKYKRVQECCHLVNQQIRDSEMSSSCPKLMQLYNRTDQAQVKKLQYKLEKLNEKREKLRSKMCQTLTSLNDLRKYSRSSTMSCRKRNSNVNGNSSSDGRYSEAPGFPRCPCGCGRCSDTEHTRYTDTSTVDSDDGRYGRSRQYEDSKMSAGPANYTDPSNWSPHYDSEKPSWGTKNNIRTEAHLSPRKFPQDTEFTSPRSKPNLKYTQPINRTKINQKNQSSEKDEQKIQGESEKKSRVTFLCPDSTCKIRIYSDDLSDYENITDPTQRALIEKGVKSVESARGIRRPNTSQSADRVDRFHQENQSYGYVPERQIRSETTMKEIEKTLRNYEQRLNYLGTLEYKVEEIKQKSSVADRFVKRLSRIKAEIKRQKAIERERSNREVSKLCSENWDLKQQIDQLTERFNAQCKKMQSLKCGAMRAKELETEAEMLKKELAEYRNGFEHQRKCISKWESVVAEHRTEIENLMNHIRKLTTMRNESTCYDCQVKGCVPRSRSYSPENRARSLANRGKSHPSPYKRSSEDEEAVRYQQACLQEARRRSHQRSPNRICCGLVPVRMNWCD